MSIPIKPVHCYDLKSDKSEQTGLLKIIPQCLNKHWLVSGLVGCTGITGLVLFALIKGNSSKIEELKEIGLKTLVYRHSLKEYTKNFQTMLCCGA